ncbi:ROK family protein [Sporosarcina sp. BI001-red]|uniref:ROK family protein n=1 Tax=Sporosarcina sp. BI001-red TaxID=2282866 RepID=UPI0013146108|nr:ROK family protein [Sporosarcina sp. BI001-red]
MQESIYSNKTCYSSKRKKVTFSKEGEKLQYIVAVDIGGTKISSGVINSEGTWLSNVKNESDTSDATAMYHSLLKCIYEAIEQAKLTKEQISLLGVAIPGQLNTETGFAIYQNNLPWTNFPLGKLLAEEFPLCQLAFEHDVISAAIGEWSVRNMTEELFVYITVSTGICASIIHRGKPLKGLGLAGEIGFFPINKEYVLETYASGSAMEREIAELCEDLSLADAFARWEQGDEELDRFFDERTYQLAIAIFNLTATLDPSVIVVGGGVINNQEKFFERIKEHYGKLCEHPLQQNWLERIEPSSLKATSGLYGVAMKAMGTV